MLTLLVFRKHEVVEGEMVKMVKDQFDVVTLEEPGASIQAEREAFKKSL